MADPRVDLDYSICDVFCVQYGKDMHIILIEINKFVVILITHVVKNFRFLKNCFNGVINWMLSKKYFNQRKYSYEYLQL